MEKLRFLIYLVIIVILYFLKLPCVYHTLPYVKPLWYKNTHTTFRAQKVADDQNIPAFDLDYYYFKDIILYYNRQGEVNFKKLDTDTLASVSKKNYIIYSKVGNEITLYSRSGTREWSLDTFSYPILAPSGNHFILMSTDNTSIKMYDQFRRQVLDKKFISTLILDFAFCNFNDNVIFGTAEGAVRLLKYDGSEIFYYEYDESKFNYIKAVCASEKGLYYGALAGLYNEKLLCFDKKGKLLWQDKTDFNRRHRISMHIDAENKLFLLQGLDSLIVRNLLNGKIKYELNLSSFNLKNIKYFKKDSVADYILCLIQGYNQNLVLFFTAKGKILWHKFIRDQYIVNCEIEKVEANTDQNCYFFLLQASDYIYTYKIFI